MGSASGPQHLSQAISELIALRGLARSRGDAQLAEIWKQVAGDKLAEQTRVLGIKRGVLQVAVANAPLLSELSSFHKFSLLETLQSRHAGLKLRDLKFHLNGDLSVRK